MTEYRMDKTTTEHYTSFEDLAKAWGRKPVNRKSKNEQKLNKDKENFLKKHMCPACKTPMTWNESTNICVCNNPECKGIKRERIDHETGETTVSYSVPYHLLDETGTSIAINILT